MNFIFTARPACIIAASIFVMLLSIQPLPATDLTFDGNAGPVDQTYGDRVTSTTMGSFGYGEHGEGFTPNVTVQYDPNAGSVYTWTSSYGDLVKVIYESD